MDLRPDDSDGLTSVRLTDTTPSTTTLRHGGGGDAREREHEHDMEVRRSPEQASSSTIGAPAAPRPAPGRTGTRPTPIPVPDGSRHASFYARRTKRALDVVVALGALVVVLPLMAVVSVVVLLTMGRPVLFRQVRVGLDGQEFEVLKFRTMKKDRRRRSAGSSYTGPDRRRTHKTKQHPLLTPVGRFLRTWSLDEVPQVLNVLRGDMSIVGPRPELPSVVAATYEPWQYSRFLVRPGLTGRWQVTARGDGDMHERTDLDIEYVREVSLREDLRLVLRTPTAMFGSHKGY